MAVPTSYTSSQLLVFMLNELGPVATDLGITDDPSGLLQAMTPICRQFDVADVSAITDMALLEAYARWQAWLVAEASAVGQTDLKSGPSGLTLSQIWDHIQVRLPRAETAWYMAQSTAALASGTASTPFYFGLAYGGRGR